MNIYYDDIYRRIPERPKWWLEGVPRYDPFRPEDVGGVMEVALVRELAQYTLDVFYDVARVYPSFDDHYSLRDGLAGYGELEARDPPCYSDAEVSWVSTATPLEIVQFWTREDGQWVRDTSLEVRLEDATGRTLLPNYVLQACKRPENYLALPPNDRWQSAVAARDMEMLGNMLAEVGCSRPAEVARMVLAKAAASPSTWGALVYSY